MSNPVVTDVNALLADYTVLYQKLRNYHWNVTGPFFFGLHAQFETMYTEMAVTIDDLAERVLAAGGRPLSTLKEQLAAARLTEDTDQPDAMGMVANIVADLETLNGSLRVAQKDAAEFQLKLRELAQKDDLERDKMIQSLITDAAKIFGEYGTRVETEQIRAMQQANNQG